MGILTKSETITIEKPYGFKCDRCSELVDTSKRTRTDSFKIDYQCGYGTENDSTTIIAYICDNCLVEIVKKELPNATIDGPY